MNNSQQVITICLMKNILIRLPAGVIIVDIMRKHTNYLTANRIVNELRR